jgi:phage FluMu protein Com
MNIQSVKERVLAIDSSKSLLSDILDKSIEHRCAACNCIIATGDVRGVWEIRCRKCGHFNTQGSALVLDASKSGSMNPPTLVENVNNNSKGGS